MNDADYTDKRYPPDYDLDGRVLLILDAARKHLEGVYRDRFSGKTWPIDGYSVSINLYEDKGYAGVAFCPKIETQVDGIPFEVADRGMWRAGPGVHLIISLIDLSLLKVFFMR